MNVESSLNNPADVNPHKGITKSGGQKHELDKFYTCPTVARACLARINLEDFTRIIEPSAGAGSFSSQIPDCIALDIHPEDDSIQKQDFFGFSLTREADNPTLVVGNPPFGQQNSLAVKFINHAASFADTVAFVLPISFKKESVQRRLDKHLHLTLEVDLPKNSFYLNDDTYHVTAVFQVWEWREEERKNELSPLSHPAFSFVGPAQADFRVQRVGGNAGKVDENLSVSTQSNYFIKANTDLISPEELMVKMSSLVFPGRDHGVGPRTVSKRELIREVDRIIYYEL